MFTHPYFSVPIHAFWDLEDRVHARCVNVNLLFLVAGGINCALDARKTSPAHFLFAQADREHRDIVSVLPCSPRKDKTDLEKYNSDRLYGTNPALSNRLHLLTRSKPIPLLWRLRTTKGQKLTLTSIFVVAGL